MCSSAFRRRPRKVRGSTDEVGADGGSTSGAVDENSECVPGPSKSGSEILCPDIPLWAAAEVSFGKRSSANERERLDQFDSRAGGSPLRDEVIVKEQRSLRKQRIAVGRVSRLEPLLTVSETAAILNVSVRTVRRLIATEPVPAVSIGRSVRLRPRDIRRLIAEGGVHNH